MVQERAELRIATDMVANIGMYRMTESSDEETRIRAARGHRVDFMRLVCLLEDTL